MNVFMQRNICTEHTIHVVGQAKVASGPRAPYIACLHFQNTWHVKPKQQKVHRTVSTLTLCTECNIGWTGPTNRTSVLQTQTPDFERLHLPAPTRRRLRLWQIQEIPLSACRCVWVWVWEGRRSFSQHGERGGGSFHSGKFVIIALHWLN